MDPMIPLARRALRIDHTLLRNGAAWGNKANKGETPTRHARSTLATVVQPHMPIVASNSSRSISNTSRPRSRPPPPGPRTPAGQSAPPAPPGPGRLQGHRQRHHTSRATRAMLTIGPLLARAATLHQFDTDAVGCSDITQQAPPDPFLQCHGKAHPFGVQLVAEGAQVAVIDEAEVVSPPSIVAGVIGVRLNLSGSRRILAGALAPNDQGLAPKLKEDLGGTTGDRVGHDVGTKHLHVPVGRVLRALANDVDMIKCEGGIAHGGGSFCEQVRVLGVEDVQCIVLYRRPFMKRVPVTLRQRTPTRLPLSALDEFDNVAVGILDHGNSGPGPDGS